MLLSSIQKAAFFGLFTIVQYCYSLPTNESVLLKPLHPSQYDGPFRLQSRDSIQYSKLDLQDKGQLLFGGAHENGSLIVANMTLFAPDGLLMVLLEHFDHLTKAIDCQGDDGQMSLTFNSQKAFDHAVEAWDHVNDNADGKFLLIANHPGCGPEEERQGYMINSIKEDPSTLTTFLAAEKAPWSEIGGSYEVDFGHTMAPRGNVERRSDWWEHLKGNFDVTKEKDFDVSIGHRDEVENLWHDDRRLMLDCVNCFVSGSFHMIGHIKTHHWDLKDATLSLSPRGVSTTMELQAKMTYTEKIGKFSGAKKSENTKDLFSVPVPDLGFEIPKVLKLGLTLSYQIGYQTKVAGSGTVKFGATASLPDEAIAIADLKGALDHEGKDKSTWSGWDGATLDPIFDVTELQATAQFAVFTQVDLAFGIELVEKAKLAAELNLKIPQLSTTFAAGYKEGGFCSKDNGSIETGVDVKTALAIELWLEVKEKWKGKSRDLFSYRIFNLTKELDDTCFPLPIPDLLKDLLEPGIGNLPMQEGLLEGPDVLG